MRNAPLPGGLLVDARGQVVDLPALLDPPLAVLQALGDRRLDVLDAERLRQVVRDALPHRLDRRFGRRERRHDQRVDVGPDLLGLLDQLHAVHPRHAQIGDQQVESIALEAIERGFAVGDVLGRVPLPVQHPRKELRDLFFVVNYENTYRCDHPL